MPRFAKSSYDCFTKTCDYHTLTVCWRVRLAGSAKQTLALLSLVAGMLATPALAQEPARLIAPGDAPYDGTAPIVIALDDELTGIDPSSVRVEIDQIDVTDVAIREGRRYTVEPPAPLVPGAHILTVLATTENGQFVELGAWTIQTVAVATAAPGSDGVQTAISSNNSIEYLRRLYSENVDGDSKPNALSGAGETVGEVRAGNWSFDSGANYFLESQNDIAPTGNTADLGEYAAALRWQESGLSLGLVAGHQDIAYDTLVMSGFNRRGISAGIGTDDDAYRADIFALAAESEVGASDLFGTAERSGHVHGASASARVWQSGNDEVRVGGTAYTGENGRTGFGTAEIEDLTGNGDGLAGQLDATWFDRRLEFAAGVAATRFDADGDGALANEDATAITLYSGYHLVRGAQFGGDILDVKLTGGWERIGTWFESVANPSLARDHNTFSLGSEFLWGGLFANVALKREENNVDDVSGAPTDRLHSAGLDAQYTFSIDRTAPDDRAWLGSPYLLFGGLVADTDRIKVPNGYVGPVTGNDTHTGYVGIGSAYQTLTLQALYQYTEYVDGPDAAGSAKTHFADFFANWYPSDRLTLGAGSQISATDQRDLGTSTDGVTGYLNADAVLIPSTLDLSAAYNLNLNSDSTDTHTVTSELRWTLREAAVNRPGFEVAWRNSAELKDGGTNDKDVYESFLVLRVTAPFEHR